MASCHCFGGNVFAEVKSDTVMGVAARVEIARRGQVNEPANIPRKSRESAIPEVSYRRFNFNVFDSKTHISALTLAISCSNAPRSHDMVRRVRPTILREIGRASCRDSV